MYFAPCCFKNSYPLNPQETPITSRFALKPVCKSTSESPMNIALSCEIFAFFNISKIPSGAGFGGYRSVLPEIISNKLGKYLSHKSIAAVSILFVLTAITNPSDFSFFISSIIPS